jgi:hypothetical protein
MRHIIDIKKYFLLLLRSIFDLYLFAGLLLSELSADLAVALAVTANGSDLWFDFLNQYFSILLFQIFCDPHCLTCCPCSISSATEPDRNALRFVLQFFSSTVYCVASADRRNQVLKKDTCDF